MSLSSQEAQSILSPFLKKYTEAIAKDDFAVAVPMYHPDSVLVHKGTRASYGRTEIEGAFKVFVEHMGKTLKVELPNEHFQGVKDYIIYTADFVTETEKAGTVKGSFLQIWKKEGDEYLIYHDEFEIAK